MCDVTATRVHLALLAQKRLRLAEQRVGTARILTRHLIVARHGRIDTRRIAATGRIHVRFAVHGDLLSQPQPGQKHQQAHYRIGI